MKKLDILNKRFGRWLVCRRAESFSKKTFWHCRCDCGTEKIVRGSSLTSGGTFSCGCAIIEHCKRDFTFHGCCVDGKNTKEYRTWLGMKNRVKSSAKERSRYFDRGIRVCEQWSDFNIFLKHMGKSPSPLHSLDRINNNDGYYASNCRWATAEEQANNRRTNKPIEFDGRTQTMAKWERELGFPEGKLSKRMKMGLSFKDALSYRRYAKA